MTIIPCYFVGMGFEKIPLEGRSEYLPSQFADKTPLWCYDNVRYFLTYYNNRNNSAYSTMVGDNAANGVGSGDPFITRLPPVQHMIRMMLYYLGMQPNMDYAFVNDDLSQTTMQSLWINNQTEKDFVDYFKGNMMSKIVRANWTGKPLSERATAERTNAWNKEMMAYDLKPYLKKIAEQFDVNVNAGQQDFELPEQVEKWMETTWKEYGAELVGDISNGIWFSEQWWKKVLQAFMHIVITSQGAMHHYVVNGKAKQEIIPPYELIFDNRSDDDYGEDDQFIGRVRSFTTNELFSRYPELTKAQRKEIEDTLASGELRGAYNTAPNILWWGTRPKRNTVSVVEMYWRTKRKTNKRMVVSDTGEEKLAKAEDDDNTQFIHDDVYQTTVIGNMYVGREGYISNLIEDFDDVSKPLMPIIRFRPNTLMGESISEVSRIAKIVDEVDYLDYKIREMVGKAKGKVYWINGERFDEASGFRGFLENINSMGIHVGMPSGEDEKAGNAVELIDWTLDPNIDKLWNLTKEKEERMKKIMSTSDISMGQQQTYTGYKTTQSTIAQNSLGTAYLFDGTMEWIVLNMRYAANVQKNIFCSKDSLEASIVVGDRGVVQLKLWEGLSFEQLYVELNVNDRFDEEQKKALSDVALANAQNKEITMLDWIKIMKADSLTVAEDIMEQSLKETEVRKEKEASMANQGNTAQIQAQGMVEAELQQLKDDNANFRTVFTEMSKSVAQTQEMIMQLLQSQPPASPLQGQMAGADQQQSAPIPQ